MNHPFSDECFCERCTEHASPEPELLASALSLDSRLPVRSRQRRSPKLMVMGYARHGKDTAGEILCRLYGYRFISSSVFCLQKAILPKLASLGFHYRDADEAMAVREDPSRSPVNWRSLWREAIQGYNAHDPARLSRELFEEYGIYCGIRTREEFLAAREARLFDLSIWIDASTRHPPESAASITVLPTDADFIVSNNGTIADLERRLRIVMEGVLDPEDRKG